MSEQTAIFFGGGDGVEGKLKDFCPKKHSTKTSEWAYSWKFGSALKNS